MGNNKLIISKKTTHEINPDMVGLFFEDINFAADGGLYAQMLENSSFEAMKTTGFERNYVVKEDNLYAWNSLGGNENNLEISSNSPICEKNMHYLRFTANKAGEGFTNKAYDGVCLKKGMKYKVSFYAREVEYSKGDIEISIVKNGKKFASANLTFIAARPESDGYKAMLGECDAKVWRKYEAELIASDDVKGALFLVCLTEPGIVEFDIFSMFPEDAVSGIFRKDLFEALADLNPGFLRFPGGCIVEGTSIMRRYRWKDTVGPIEQRKINTNLWAAVGGNTTRAFEMPDCHYMQSYGIGFYEYFLLCELLSSKRVCKPLPVLNIGVACQFRSYETVSVEDPFFDEYVQDALDLIEFANGPIDSKWGALRAGMGHPESFNLEMIAIGNEQWESRQVDLAKRYKIFEKAIHDKYPEIKCLGTAGPFVGNDTHKNAWDFYYDEAKKNPDFSYAVDEHYYVASQWLYDNVAFYDNYPRDVFVFAGEYAAHDANLSNSVEAGIAEAAMMTGMEKNGDVVKLASYAPLLNRIGHSHWTPDMIWFDEDTVTLTPSYYTQKLFSDYAGKVALELNGQEKQLRENKLYISLVGNDEKTILKVVNANAEAQEIELWDEEGNAINGKVEFITMKAANGKAQVPVASAAIAEDNNHQMPLEKMSNSEVCALRAPEEASYTVEQNVIDGKIELPAKSLVAIVM